MRTELKNIENTKMNLLDKFKELEDYKESKHRIKIIDYLFFLLIKRHNLKMLAKAETRQYLCELLRVKDILFHVKYGLYLVAKDDGFFLFLELNDNADILGFVLVNKNEERFLFETLEELREHLGYDKSARELYKKSGIPYSIYSVNPNPSQPNPP